MPYTSIAKGTILVRPESWICGSDSTLQYSFTSTGSSLSAVSLKLYSRDFTSVHQCQVSDGKNAKILPRWNIFDNNYFAFSGYVDFDSNARDVIIEINTVERPKFAFLSCVYRHGVLGVQTGGQIQQQRNLLDLQHPLTKSSLPELIQAVIRMRERGLSEIDARDLVFSSIKEIDYYMNSDTTADILRLMVFASLKINS